MLKMCWKAERSFSLPRIIDSINKSSISKALCIGKQLNLALNWSKLSQFSLIWSVHKLTWLHEDMFSCYWFVTMYWWLDLLPPEWLRSYWLVPQDTVLSEKSRKKIHPQIYYGIGKVLKLPTKKLPSADLANSSRATHPTWTFADPLMA